MAAKRRETRRGALWAAGAAVLLALAGCASGTSTSDGGPIVPHVQDIEPPAITEAAVTPSVMEFTGGIASVAARISDPGGVVEAWAALTRPEGGVEQITLTTAGQGTYAGSWKAPANLATGTTQTYTVRIFARDGAGNVGETSALSLQVASPEAPPPMPL